MPPCIPSSRHYLVNIYRERLFFIAVVQSEGMVLRQYTARDLSLSLTLHIYICNCVSVFVFLFYFYFFSPSIFFVHSAPAFRDQPPAQNRRHVCRIFWAVHRKETSTRDCYCLSGWPTGAFLSTALFFEREMMFM